MTLTLMPMDFVVTLDDNGQPVMHTGFAMLGLAPNKAMLDVMRALLDRHPELDSEATETSLFEGRLPPNMGIAWLDSPETEPARHWAKHVLASELKQAWQEAKDDPEWWK